MAQFMGTVQGSRGLASRLGGKDSGMHVTINGWNIGCDARIYYDKETGQDIICIYLTKGSNSSQDKLLGIFKEKEAWT